MNTYEFHKGMKQHFGITDEAGQFMCKTYLIMREAHLDIVKFDRWLQKDIGYDFTLKEGLSIKQAIAKYYSEDAVTFIQKAL